MNSSEYILLRRNSSPITKIFKDLEKLFTIQITYIFKDFRQSHSESQKFSTICKNSQLNHKLNVHIYLCIYI